jgi:hypothetical protein
MQHDSARVAERGRSGGGGRHGVADVGTKQVQNAD